MQDTSLGVHNIGGVPLYTPLKTVQMVSLQQLYLIISMIMDLCMNLQVVNCPMTEWLTQLPESRD